MESPTLVLRLPVPLMRAAKAKAAAAGVSVGQWTRSLIERETGVAAEMREGGFANMSPAKHRRISRAAGKASAAKRAEGEK